MDNPIGRIATPVARFAAILCGYGVLALSLAVAVEIVGRKFFGFSLQGIDDIGGYALAISASAGACHTMAVRGHTRIGVFVVRMPRVWQAILNATAMVALAVFAVFAFWRGSNVIEESVEFRSVATNPLRTPMRIPQGAWLFGLGLFAACAFACAAHALYLLAADRRRLNRLYGPSTARPGHGHRPACLRRRPAVPAARAAPGAAARGGSEGRRVADDERRDRRPLARAGLRRGRPPFDGRYRLRSTGDAAMFRAGAGPTPRAGVRS